MIATFFKFTQFHFGKSDAAYLLLINSDFTGQLNWISLQSL